MRQPFACAISTRFGIGYLLAGLKKRWLIALGGNLALLIIGHFANASKNPALWAAIFSVGFRGYGGGFMAVDPQRSNPDLGLS